MTNLIVVQALLHMARGAGAGPDDGRDAALHLYGRSSLLLCLAAAVGVAAERRRGRARPERHGSERGACLFAGGGTGRPPLPGAGAGRGDDAERRRPGRGALRRRAARRGGAGAPGAGRAAPAAAASSRSAARSALAELAAGRRRCSGRSARARARCSAASSRDLVVGTGGYASGPAVRVGACCSGVPIGAPGAELVSRADHALAEPVGAAGPPRLPGGGGAAEAGSAHGGLRARQPDPPAGPAAGPRASAAGEFGLGEGRGRRWWSAGARARAR